MAKGRFETRLESVKEEKKKDSTTSGKFESALESIRKGNGYPSSSGSTQAQGSNGITSRVNNWLNNHNSYVRDYENRYSGRKYSYADAYVSDSADWLNTMSERKKTADAEADAILSYLDQNKDYLDAEWAKQVRDTITGARESQRQIVDIATQDNQWWNSFGTEELLRQYGSAEKAYTATGKAIAKRNDQLALDTEAYAAELEELKKFVDEAYDIGGWYEYYQAGKTDYLDYDKSEDPHRLEIYNRLQNEYGGDVSLASDDYIQRGRYLQEAKRVQEQAREDEEYAKQLAPYLALMQNDDFAEKSAFKTKYLRPAEKYTPAGSNHTYVIDTGYEDIWYDYINRQDDAIKLQGLSDMAGYAEFAGYDKGYLKEMEDDEIKIYNYLYATQGKESADEFVGLLTSELAYRTRKRIQEENALYAKEHPIHASAWSILSSPAKSISAIGQIGDYIDDGKIDENAGYNKYSYQNSAIRNTVANNIAKPENGAWGKVGSWTYQLGMSMGDFVMNTAVSGGNSVIASALMGSSAMADTVIAAKDRGLSDDQAFILGVIAGGAEIITEKVSLDALLKGDLSKGTLKYILTNAFTEGTEEVNSSVINLMADVFFSKDQSEWEMSIKKYLEEHPGATETDAFTNVLFDTAASLGLDFLGGSLMGGTMGSVRAGINYVTEVAPALGKNKEAVEKYGKSVPEMIKAGLSSDPKSRGYDLANFYQSKIDSGKELSGYEIRQLKEAIETDAAIEFHGKLEEARAQFVAETKKEAVEVAKARLTELGETGDVDAIADAVAKKVMSERLTSKERKLLVNSFGSQVAKEMTPGENESTYKAVGDRIGNKGQFGVSELGKAVVRDSGKEVDLSKAEVTKVGDGKITFKLEDGSEVYAGDIDFASDDQSYLVYAIANIENITPDAATAIIRDIVDPSKPLGKQLNGIDEAFTYGYNGYSEADLKAGSFTGGITKKQMMSAYKLGQSARNANTEAADANKVRMRTALQAKLTATERAASQRRKFESGNVGVYFMDGKNITKVGESGGYKGTGQDVERRMAAVNYAKLLSKLGIGNNYYFFESYLSETQTDEDGNPLRVYKDSDGNEVSAPNGFYREGTGDIYIDLNAGNEGQGVALFTLGHELTHFIKEWSEKKFKVLADFLVAEYGNTDLTMRERVLAKQAELEDIRKNQDDYKPVKYQEAFEEVVADAMSAMLADGNLHEKLAELRTKDKGLGDKIIEFFSRMIAKFQALYKDLDPEQRDARDVRAMKDSFDRIQQAFAEALVEASDNFRASMESVVESGSEAVDANEIITDGAVVTDGNGEKRSIRSMKHDIAEGKMFEDLKKVCGWTDAQVKTLRTQLTDLVEYMIPYRNILDMNESYGMEGRRFSPYKPNSDPLYKISMDFSTLCSKRLLTQYVIEQLQLRENRPMSAEEQMAIRDMLNEYRKVEKGLQVACAMCYVEAARLKSPKQMQRWLDDPAPHLINYFALKNTEFNDSVKKAQADFKESRGYDRNAPKKDMKQADVRELNKIGPRLRAEYQPSAEEQAIIEKAKSLPNSTYLTAGNLASLSETDPVIYAAYTSFVRTATRSKSLETDEPYYYGDSTRDNGNGIIVSDSFIEAVNRENGMRFSSWSDWRIQHMLDYITAVIDNSVRGAAMHGYTKFPDEVRVLGKTGMMFNMSGVAGTQTGLNEDGTLNFSETESIDVNEAIQRRKEFPETAGLQCIGVGNEHIIALLRSDIIDYVIPYHVSGLNAALRRMADIHGWKDYTSTQHAVVDKNIKLEDAADKEHWHEEPVFSEFFVGYDTGMSGIEAMRASAEKYKQMCRDRGLKPKFEQFANEDNYWKLLIDRKMINQQTGNLIRQKAVTPTFDFGTIKGVVDKFVQNYDAGLEARALGHIVENWDSIPQRIKDLKKKSGSKAKKTAKAVDTLANETVAAQPTTKKSERDSAGNKLSKQQQEFFIDSVVRDKDGNLLIMYHGTSKGGYTVFDTYYGNHGLFGIGSYFTDNKEIAQTYTKKGRGTSPQVYEVYLDIRNPLDMDAKADPAEWAEAFPDVDFPENGTNEEFYRAVEQWCEDEMMYKWDAAETIQAGIESGMGYDGITHIGGGRVDPNGVRHRVYIAFQPEQIKRTDNQNPTKNPDIRYSERSGDAVSNRTLLANAFEGLSQNSDEYAMIQEYRNRIRLLEEQEEKLDKINAEIREIRFTSGKYDAKKLAELEAKKKEISKAITRHDKKLLEMEVSAPFRKVIEQERKNEAQKTKTHIAEIQQNKQLRAEQAELRHKVRKVIRDLDKILKRGNKEQNVKEDMKGFVSKALELADYLFTDHISNDDLIMRGIDADLMRGDEAELVRETEEIIQQIQDNYGTITEEEYKRLTARKRRNMEALRELLTKQRNRRLNTPVYNLFDDLVTEYAKLKNSDQDAVKAAYNPEVERFLRSYMGDTMDGADSDKKTLLQNMRVADMTTQELEHLYYAYTMVLHSVRDANKLFVQGKAESVQKMADQIFADFSQRKIPEKKIAIVARNIANKIGWDYEKLYYALDRVGSEAFTELVMNVANSENIVMQDVIESAIFRDEMVEKYGFNNWDVSKKIDREFLDNTGKKFKLTLGQLMALYAYSRRKGALDHIEYGGFVFGDEELTNPNPADSYKLTREQCEALTDLLTKEQKGYVEAMQKFLSETMGGKGNEVSMMLYGIKMFTEKNYFPIKVAGQFKPQAQEAQAKAAAGFSSMTNAGFTHEQNPNAKAPFVLEGFNEVWADHVNEMSRYHGTVPALEDMRRVMNRSSYSEAGTESMSIKQLMENAFGKEAVDYFDALYREANSGAVRDKLQADSHKLLSLFRKNSVAYSLSVLIQQPASVVRAYAMIDRKYFGLKGFGVITSGVAKAVTSKWNKAYANAYNEMLKYAPGVTMAKEIGGFDTHTGSSIRGYLLDTKKSFGQKVKTDKHGKIIGGIKAAYEFVDDNAIANLPNVADKIAWIEIWNACKRETIAKHKDLVPTSDAFLQIVGDRFTEVIRATQVYDSMFSKSPMLKSKNLAVQYLVSFMNEPNTVANMAEKAVRDMTKGNWKNGLKTVHVVIHSIIFTNLLKSIIYAMRDDDEDETYIEKYIEALSSGLFNDFIPFNYIPIARDVWSLAQGYDVERADMAIVADAIDAIYGVSKNWLADKDSMTEEQLEEFDKKVIEANWKLAESLAAFAGIPVKNIRREINGFMDHARIASENAGKTTLLSAWDKVRDGVIDSIPFMQSDRAKGDKLYEAMITGDKAYLDRIKDTYKTDDAYESAVIKALRENDPRIHEAAQAGVNGDSDERNRIFREIKAELGAKYANFVISAINSEVSAIRNEEKPENVDGKYDAFDFMSAVTQKDTKAINDIREDIISTYVANNKTKEQAEKEFVSATKSAMKEMYLYDMLSESEASSALKAYCPDGDDPLDNDDVYWIIRKWNYEKENGSSDGYSQYNDFRDAVQTGKSLQLVIDEYVSHGIEEKTLASQITSHFKPLYKKMSYSDRVSLKRRLLDAYDALGYNRSKKSKDIDEWLDD